MVWRAASRGIPSLRRSVFDSPQWLSGAKNTINSRNYSDRVVVDPREYSDAETGDFFKYQTGRWLVNDAVERSKRSTRFNIKGLFEVVQANSGIQSPTETIEPWFEGKHNKLYRVELQDKRAYILRIPYSIADPEYIRLRLLSEVATMAFSREIAGVKTPSVLSYSGTADNELETPYILMDFVAGRKMAETWNPAADVEEKMPALEATSKLASKLLGPEFKAIGSLYFKEDLPDGIATDYENFVIGPSTEKRFWRGSGISPEKRNAGPWTSVTDYLKATADVQLGYVESALAVEPDNSSLKSAKAAAERYVKLASILLTDETVASTGGIRLNNPDFGPLNILEQEDGTQWVIDFENSSVKPYALHGLPWFVRSVHERIYKVDDVPDFEKLPEFQQQIVRHIVSLTQSEFNFEKLLIKDLPAILQAHNPSIKRREELVRTVMNTDIDRDGFFNDIDYAVFKLAHMWPILGIEGESPIQFTPETTQEIEKSVTEWNQRLMTNRYLENKNFVGAPEFDQLLGEGKITPDGNGNYELTKAYYDSLPKL